MDIPFETQKEGYSILKNMVEIREQSRGSRFYNIWKQDCQKFADKLIAAGADEQDIIAMVGWNKGTTYYCGVLLNKNRKGNDYE